LAGDVSTAREAVNKLLAAHPNASVELMKQCHPLRCMPRIFKQMVDGWRLAGLAEK
jgi:hypothetical protein